MQLSYCYIAKAHHHSSAPTLTENELRLGMSVAWMTLNEALDVMAASCTNVSVIQPNSCFYAIESFLSMRLTF